MNEKLPRLIFNRCRFISKRVRGKRVLDIGCVDHDFSSRDRGRWLHDDLCETAEQVTGLDYEAGQVEAMQAAGYNVVCGDATDFDLGETFDVVVAGELIEHLINPGAFLKCVRKHLKPDGELILTTPNGNCLIYFLENLLMGREFENSDHSCLFTPLMLRSLLNKTGFEMDGVSFIAESTAHFHTALWAKALVGIKQGMQVLFGFFQPSLCHQFLVVARVASQQGDS